MMKKQEETGFKENELLAGYLIDFKIGKKEKLFWQVVAGILGQNYKKLKEIPESEQLEILNFLQRQEKEVGR